VGRNSVSPQVHGIHPPRKLIFFSRVLERLIEKVWRQGPFFRIREEKVERASKRRSPGEGKVFGVGRKNAWRGREPEAYEPTNYVYVWELGVKRRKWERVKEYFGVMSEYERAGESGCNAKYGAEILKEI